MHCIPQALCSAPPLFAPAQEMDYVYALLMVARICFMAGIFRPCSFQERRVIYGPTPGMETALTARGNNEARAQNIHKPQITKQESRGTNSHWLDQDKSYIPASPPNFTTNI